MATGSGESALSAEGVFSPTNFLLEEVLIQRQNLGGADAGQDSIDVKAIVPEIKIRESIYNNAINVDIRLFDSQKLLEFLRINGTEKIKLKIARSAQATEKDRFELNLVIADIDMFTQVNPSTQSYVLRCVPEYIIRNQGETVSQKFSDLTEDIKAISASLGIDLKVGEEEGSQKTNGVIPIMKPLSAINWLKRNMNKTGTPFYYYGTSNGEVHLKSYLSMISDIHEEDEEYTDNTVFNYYTDAPIEKDSTDDFFKIEKYHIRKLNSKLKLSGMRNIGNGAFGSNKFSTDIYAKSYKADEEFKYEKINNRLNEHQPFPKDLKFNEKTLDQYNKGKNYYINLNSGAFDGDGKNYHSIIDSTIQQKEAYHHLLDTHHQELILAGDFQMQVGKSINVRIFANAADEKLIENESITPGDKMATGKYLITSLEHSFTNQEFTTRVVCKKDSFGVDVNKPDAFFINKENTVEGASGENDG